MTSIKLSHISVETLKGVGKKVAEKLATLSILNLEDLLFHLPIRYQDRSRISPIGTLLHGQTVQVFGMVEAADIVFGKRRSLVCKISDATGILDIRLFHFSMAQKKQFVRGEYIQCYGQVSYSGRGYAMVHPEIKFMKSNSIPELTDRLIAVYPTTSGLAQKTFRSLIKQALTYLNKQSVKELLPKEITEELNYPPLSDALNLLHQPPLDISLEDIKSGEHPLIQRLAFEELMAQHIALKQIKTQQQTQQAFTIQINNNKNDKLINQLPFCLTKAQKRVIEEIYDDLKNPYPMTRLVQGDVGCGKTLVAGFALYQVSVNDYQSAIMAPTEILAEQHFNTLSKLFTPLGITVTLLTSKMPTKEKKESLEQIETGISQIIIGTHALFQQQVNFKKLALIVIDEQHRFGVEQRRALLDKSSNTKSQKKVAHQLIMTATPIPRTLAQSVYADLDLSIIDELPPGRKKIETSVLSNSKREEIINRIEQACQQDKRQVYWVCTLIDESEEIECQAAEKAHKELADKLPNLKVGLVHGRMKSIDKNEIMNEFKSGSLDILVATTVIEVGVDVPNASLMVIENSERLGLSQLHQLRGRVGRGDKDSYCILMYQPPLTHNGKERLNIMRKTNDGFLISEKDLEIRGAGEILGTRQTGDTLFRFADLTRDKHLIPLVEKYHQRVQCLPAETLEPLNRRWLNNKQALAEV